MKALALDFDGVISDSAPEAYGVALRTFREEFPESGLTPGAEDDESLYARFLEIMPLGNRAEDFAVALAAIDSETPLPDQAAYDAFHASLDRDRLKAFHKRFYRVRHAWTEAEPARWFSKIQPYPGICEWLHRRSSDVQLAVATAKDRHSVALLLERYGIGGLFGDGWVHDKETGVSKRAHVAAIAARVGCTVDEVTFIDDKVNHLVDVGALGARCLLAGWGYNGARERLLAREAGFAIASLEDLDARVFG